MLLVIDAGNTNIVFALFDGDEKIAVWRTATDVKKTADDLAVWLTPLFRNENLSFKDVKTAIICSVVPPLDYALRKLCRQYFKVAPLTVNDKLPKLGLKIKLAQPEQLGADRIVNAVAARAFYECPAMIIDFGTATTFDILDRRGDYIGGVIAPGPDLSLQALYMTAAKLPPVDLVRPRQVIGTDTVSAMQSGVFFGYVGLIEGLIARIEESRKGAMTVIATGGLAGLFTKAISRIDVLDQDLTLKGLRILHEMNT